MLKVDFALPNLGRSFASLMVTAAADKSSGSDFALDFDVIDKGLNDILEELAGEDTRLAAEVCHPIRIRELPLKRTYLKLEMGCHRQSTCYNCQIVN